MDWSHHDGLRLASLLALSACVGLEGGGVEVDQHSQGIINGQTTTAYEAVPYLALTLPGAGAGCTGSLVSPRVVLTAAHCLDGEEGEVTAVSAYFGSTVEGPDEAYLEEIEAEDWIFVPNWSLSSGDFGLILLAHDAPVEPLPYNTQALSVADEGSSLHLIGWGNTSGAGGAGTKRHVTAPIGEVNQWLVEYGSADGNTCQGDSGGPGFLDIGGQEVVASVTSWGVGGCLGNSGAGRVDMAADWIADYIADKDVPIPPTVSFVKPVQGDVVKPGFSVQLDATDNTRIDRLELWTDGAKLIDVPTQVAPYIVTTPSLPDGPTTLEARAYDNRGDSASTTVLLNVCSEGDCDAIDGSLGSACDGNEDCIDGLCGTIDDEKLCTAPCTTEETCPDGFECRGDETGGFCWPSEEGGGCGCRAGGGAAGTPALILLALLALRWRRRSR